MSVRRKYLSAVCMAAVGLSLTSCHVNTKPDHPQVRESFSDRKAPRDNQLASSGALANVGDTSSFQPINKVTLSEKSQSDKSSKGLISGIFGGSSTNSDRAPAGNHITSDSSTPASGDEDFFSRLYKRLFASEDEVMQVAQVRFMPRDNHMHSTSQGSSESSYSFYELGDEIGQNIVVAQITPPAPPSIGGVPQPPVPPAAPAGIAQAPTPQVVIPEPPKVVVQDATKVIEEKMQAQQVTAPVVTNENPAQKEMVVPTQKSVDAPMVATPVVPSDAEMKSHANEGKPEFKDVPKAPKAETKKAKPAKKKVVKKKKPDYSDTKYKDPINSVSPEEYRPQEPDSKIEIRNGKHVYTGTLGELKHCDKSDSDSDYRY